MTPILICSLHGSKTLKVCETSILAYTKCVPIIKKVKRSTFGESYNKALAEAFKTYDEVIIANDDICLTPDSYALLLQDVEQLKQSAIENGFKLGIVGARFDSQGLPTQMISNLVGRQNEVFQVPVVAPVFAWISKEAFETAKFPPLNWFSDNILCMDLDKAGFLHFVSRSYVHHAGSQTIGNDTVSLMNEAKPWLKENRPEFHDAVFPSLDSMYKALCETKSDINEHLPVLYRYASQSKVVVELGTRYAVSTIALLNGLKSETPKSLFAYDIVRTGEVNICETLAIDNGINFTFTQADDLAIKIPECDFLFIDTLHDYKQLSQELALHSGRVRKWIALHDTTSFGHVDESGGGSGLMKAVNEFLAYGNFKIKESYRNNNGLTILERVK